MLISFGDISIFFKELIILSILKSSPLKVDNVVNKAANDYDAVDTLTFVNVYNKGSNVLIV